MVAIVLGLCVAGCGDNTIPAAGPALAPSDVLFVAAHFDDDMIFMQPELLDALANHSVTTVYVTSGDPKKGEGRERAVFAAARTAYSAVLGSHDWDCGEILLVGEPARHCRLRDREVSLVALDLPDGGLDGAHRDSLLHLVDGEATSVPILGPEGGRANVDDIVGELAELIETTAPSQIHALDVAATHGRDHSSHLLSSSFALWGAARVGYTGALRWHRGYNVEDLPATLTDETAPARMLGYFEACYFGFAPCGSPSARLDTQEHAWMQRQYSFDRVTGATLDAGPVLDEHGHLAANGGCLASTPDGRAYFTECADVAEQYWVLDSEGHLWNGAPPAPTGGMDYDHVRCLAALDSAPTCGADLQPTWLFR